jgi:hypothetical protein
MDGGGGDHSWTREPIARPPRPHTLTSLPRTPRLGLGCPTLDGLLRGGLPVGKLTEVVGE